MNHLPIQNADSRNTHCARTNPSLSGGKLPAYQRCEVAANSKLNAGTGSFRAAVCGVCIVLAFCLLSIGMGRTAWGASSTSDAPGMSQTSAPHVVLHTESTSLICLAMDAHGALYLADENAGTIRCITRDGEKAILVRGLSAPCAVAVDHKRQLVVGTRKGELWRILPTGEAILLGKGLPSILSVTIDRDGAALAATAAGDLIRLGGD